MLADCYGATQKCYRYQISDFAPAVAMATTQTPLLLEKSPHCIGHILETLCDMFNCWSFSLELFYIKWCSSFWLLHRVAPIWAEQLSELSCAVLLEAGTCLCLTWRRSLTSVNTHCVPCSRHTNTLQEEPALYMQLIGSWAECGAVTRLLLFVLLICDINQQIKHDGAPAAG